MRALKGTLLFVLGMILGIILFVVAIAGAVFAIATSVSVGELQNQLGTEIFDPDSEIIDKTIWDTVQDVIQDVQNINKFTIGQLKTKYGLKIPDEIQGIDITPLFSHTVETIGEGINEVVNNITINDVDEITGGALLEGDIKDLPVIKDNLYNSITATVNELLGSINDDLSLRAVEDKFGITIGGENAPAIITAIMDTPIGSLGDIINGLTIGQVIGVDSDVFIDTGKNTLYRKPVETDAKADTGYYFLDGMLYVPLGSELHTRLQGTPGVTSYLTADNGTAVYKELRFIKKDVVVDEQGGTVTKFYVDNSSEEGEFFCQVQYLPDRFADNTEFFIETRSNTLELAETENGTRFVLKHTGFVSLNDLFYDEAGTHSLASSLSADNGCIDITDLVYYRHIHGEGEAAIDAAESAFFGYGEQYPSVGGKLTEVGSADVACAVRIHTGTADPLIQSLGDVTIGGLQNATDELMNIKLGDILPDLEEDSFLYRFKDKTINELTSAIDEMTLGELMDVKYSDYTANAHGAYVYVETGASYEKYDSTNADHLGKTLYIAKFAENPESGKYMLVDGKYYLYAEGVEHNGRFDKIYVQAEEDAPEGELFVKISAGYYTPYNPANPDHHEKDGDGNTIWEKPLPRFDKSENQPEGADAAVLQRIAGYTINSINDAFNEITIGDATPFDFDVYERAAEYDPNTVYYVYQADKTEGGAKIFEEAGKLSEEEYNNGGTYYVKTKVGTDSAVIKKLTYMGINDIGSGMDDVINSMYLDEVISVRTSAYYPSENGAYVYVEENGNGYYTIYNPADYKGGQRYDLYKDADESVEWSIATDAEIAENTALYTYDAEKTQMVPFENGNPQEGETYYVQKAASSKVIQRIAHTKISGMDKIFDELLISDVIDMDADVFEKASSEIEGVTEYYTYDDDNCVFIRIEKPEDLAVGGPYYYVAKAGAGQAILKKMAFIPVGEMGDSMDTVIKNTYIGDIVEINDTDEATVIDGGAISADDTVFIPYSPEYTEVYEDENKKEYVSKYTYIVDNKNGAYYANDEVLLPATDKQIRYGGEQTVYFRRVKESDINGWLDAKFEQDIANISPENSTTTIASITSKLNTISPLWFYKKASAEDGEKQFALNQAVVLRYLAPAMAAWANNALANRYPHLSLPQKDVNLSIPLFIAQTDAPNGEDDIQNKTFFEVQTTSFDVNFKKPETETTPEKHYVFIKNGKGTIPFDPTDAAHMYLGKEALLLRYEGGIYPIMNDKVAENISEQFVLKNDEFVQASPEEMGDPNVQKYCQLNEIEQGKYYFVALDSGYTDGNKYSMVQCYDVLLKQNADDKDTLRCGYIGTGANVLDSNGKITEYYNNRALKINVTTAKSSSLMIALKDVSIGGLDTAISETIKVSDIIDIQPESLFDNDDIRNSSIPEIGNNMNKIFTELTIPDMISVSGAAVDADILNLLEGITIRAFFRSITFSDGTDSHEGIPAGTIYIDLLKLYNIWDGKEQGSQTP